MHNARARNARRGLTVTVQHAIEQGAAPVARGRMYDIASGFVNDDERLVFIKNIQRHGFGSESAHIRRSFGMDHNRCGFKRRLAQTGRSAVYLHAAGFNPVLQAVAWIIGEQTGQRFVQTLARQRARNVRNPRRGRVRESAATIISGCSFLSDKLKEASTWSDEKLYEHAQQALSEHDWGLYAKYFGMLEGRAALDRYAQQAQLNAAYCNWKDKQNTAAL